MLLIERVKKFSFKDTTLDFSISDALDEVQQHIPERIKGIPKEKVILPENDDDKLVSIIKSWIELEQSISRLATRYDISFNKKGGVDYFRPANLSAILNFLLRSEKITHRDLETVLLLRNIRNQVAHNWFISETDRDIALRYVEMATSMRIYFDEIE